MNQSTRKLNDNEQKNVNLAVDFLVPYVHSIVEISSEVDLPIDKFKTDIMNLYFIYLKNLYEDLPVHTTDGLVYYYWLIENQKIYITKQNTIKNK